MPQVSIIIPTYNRVATLLPAIQSAKRAGPDVEVIVVDNGSTDATAELCAKMPGIRYTRIFPNVRQARARNAGVKLSTGNYLVFLDDDDVRLPASLPAQTELLDRNPKFAFVYAPVLMGDVNCEPTGEVRPTECPAGDLFWKLLDGNFILFHSVVMRRHLVEDVGLFDPELVGAEDWMLLIKLSERGLVGATEDPVAIYRMYTAASGQTSSRRAHMCAIAAKTQAKALRLPRALAAPPARRKAARKRFLRMLATTLIHETAAAIADGNYWRALQDYLGALRMDPVVALHPYNLKTFLTVTRTLQNVQDVRQ